jgi:RHS repeat-associated protein
MATRPIVCRTPTPDYPPRGAAVLLVAGYEYGPYGEVVREDGWYAAHNRIGYRGQYRERVAGVAIDELVYHGYRYYSPRQGRFINRDPIGEAGGSNGYGYVWNDPVNRIDWLGLRGVWHGAGFEGGGSGQEDEPKSADAAAISRVVERGRVLVSRVFGRWDVFPAIERVLAQGEVTAKQSAVAGQSGDWTDQDARGAGYASGSYADDGAGFADVGVDYNSRGGFSSSLYLGEDGVYYHAFRGTQPTSGANWWANIKQALGFRSVQYDQAVDLAREVYRATGGNVVFVGHSLGGGLASAAAYATGGNAITFNAAGLSSRYRVGDPGSIRAHYIRGDILTVGQGVTPLPRASGTRISHGASSWYYGPGRRHTMSNFLDLGPGG